MHQFGGVPSDEKYLNMSDAQWVVLLTYIQEREKRQMETYLDLVEYLALLVSFNPKATKQAIDERRLRAKVIEDRSKEDFGKVVNTEGHNAYGHHLNTSFLDTIKQFGGEEAIKKMQEEGPATASEPIILTKEDNDFIRNAMKMKDEVMKDKVEEDKFKKDHPELFQNFDSIIY